MNKSNVVFIDGCRTPFLRSGTNYLNLMAYELGRHAIKGLLLKTGLNAKDVDQVIMGIVVANAKTSNVAREAALTAGIHSKAHCQTVTQACISANRAICNGINELLLGNADVVIAGGVENISDTPITFPKKMRTKLFAAQKIKSPIDGLKFLFSLRPSDFLPDKPAVAEFTTNRTMGEDCDIMVAKYGVTRKEQDNFAARSHQLASKAQESGFFDDEIHSISLPNNFKEIAKDNGIRGNTTIEKISKLRPAFDKKYGSLTAANSSFLTDGGAAVLLTTEKKAIELNLKPKARIIDYVFTGQDVDEELLLGPVYAISEILKKTGLSISDIDVFELHEAFAGQVLAVLKCLTSDFFAKEKLNRGCAVGEIPLEKLNLWGGSLSIGHPFGATGARLVTTAANRLIKENGKYALIAACAAGAHGHAIIIEKY